MSERERSKYNALIRGINYLIAAGSLLMAFQFLILSMLVTGAVWAHFWAFAALITFMWTGYFVYVNSRGRH